MIPQDGGGSEFRLSSPHGSVRSINDIYTYPTTGQKYSGVQINPGLVTNYGWFTGRLASNDSAANELQRSITASYDIYSARDLRARKMYWNAANKSPNVGQIRWTGSAWAYPNITNMSSGVYESNDVWAHINVLYQLIRDFGSTMKSWVPNYVTNNARSNTWVPSWSQVTGKPSTFPAAHHVHKMGGTTKGYGRYDVNIIGGAFDIKYTDIDGSNRDGQVVTSLWTYTGGVEERA